jgi:cytosine/adenosine deaminase-related metal-dependent hydrolase
MTIIPSVTLLSSGAGDQTFNIAMDGDRIASITPSTTRPTRRLLAIPGMANAHDHARPLSPTSFGAAGKPLETWILRLGAMPAIDPYLQAAASLGRAARAGCASIMAHCTKLNGPMSAIDEARNYARAARDIGARVTFAMFMRDRNPVVYGATDDVLNGLPPAAAREIERVFCNPMPGIREQIERVDAIAEACEGPLFGVQYGPNGVQWCSDAMLEAIAEASARTGRRVHMHLLETLYQRAWVDQNYPGGVVKHLRDIGLLSPRLALAHCVHARPDELDMIAEAGATIVTNASSNLHLRSGVAPIGEALRRRCRVAIGVDGSAFDEDDDVVRELRLTHFLHGGWGFDETISREKFLDAVVKSGRFANGAPGNGAIAPGQTADILLLDLDALDRDAIIPTDPLDLLFARANATHVAQVFVAGRKIVENGKLTGLDLDAIHAELRGQFRARMPQKAEFIAAWADAEPRVADFYRNRMGCC